MKAAVLPSNQHLNEYRGIPSVTEEKWAAAVCAWVVRRLKERGIEAGYFHVPGAGSKSTDELSQMLAQAIAWRPDYMLSVHSDAVGDTRQTGILMLMAREVDRSEGQRLGKAIAVAVGLPYKATWVYGVEARTIMYLSRLRSTGLEGSLVEVGEHATVIEAAWNWTHIKQIGVGIANALAEYLGQEGDDDMTPEQDKTLKLIRVSMVAQSNDQEIAIAIAKGNIPEAERLMNEAHAQAMTEKARLGV